MLGGKIDFVSVGNLSYLHFHGAFYSDYNKCLARMKKVACKHLTRKKNTQPKCNFN